eukprot:7385266-Prymnesium_polylepis.3
MSSSSRTAALWCVFRLAQAQFPEPEFSQCGALALCSNGALGCQFAVDGGCDDGGPGAEYSSCTLGDDCTDCGVRCPSGTPPAP